MFKTSVKRNFIAKHSLKGDFGKESKPHKHNYSVEWICVVERLDYNDFGVDIALMEKILQGVSKKISNVFLNDMDFFKDKQTSIENMAIFFFNNLKNSLISQNYQFNRIKQMEIKIFENKNTYSSYIIDL